MGKVESDSVDCLFRRKSYGRSVVLIYLTVFFSRKVRPIVESGSCLLTKAIMLKVCIVIDGIIS